MNTWKEAIRGKKQQEAGVWEHHSQSLGSRVMGGGERLKEWRRPWWGCWARSLEDFAGGRCLELCFTVSLASDRGPE